MSTLPPLHDGTLVGFILCRSGAGNCSGYEFLSSAVPSFPGNTIALWFSLASGSYSHFVPWERSDMDVHLWMSTLLALTLCALIRCEFPC